jgi:hypothetical protein
MFLIFRFCIDGVQYWNVMFKTNLVFMINFAKLFSFKKTLHNIIKVHQHATFPQCNNAFVSSVLEQEAQLLSTRKEVKRYECVYVVFFYIFINLELNIFLEMKIYVYCPLISHNITLWDKMEIKLLFLLGLTSQQHSIGHLATFHLVY